MVKRISSVRIINVYLVEIVLTYDGMSRTCIYFFYLRDIRRSYIIFMSVYICCPGVKVSGIFHLAFSFIDTVTVLIYIY